MNAYSIITSFFMTVASLTLFGGRVVQLPTLPCGELPNSEVVTNVALNVDFARLENLTFSLELNACASNSLSIAVGKADGDSLTVEKADFEWGYDCGKCFAPTLKRVTSKNGRNRVQGVSRAR